MSSTKQTAGKKNWLLIVLALILALTFVGGIVYSAVESSGAIQRGRVAMSTENYKVTNSMMTYFFKYQYNVFVSQNSYYLSYYGLDTSKSLKSQYVGSGTTQTWFAYFMDSAVSEVESTLALCEAAKAKGIALDDEDKKEIDDAFKSLKTTAKAYGMSLNGYIAAMYGNGVNSKDVRKCFELSQLASKMAEAMEESYSYTDEEKTKYAEDNKSKFYTAEYLTYSFKADYATGADDAAKKTALEEAKKLADELAEKTTEETFFQYIHDYKVEQAKKDAKEGEEPKAVEDDADDYRSTAAYGEDTDLQKWLFDAETKVNDTKVIEDETNETYKVYLMTKTSAKADYQTVNVRHILLTSTTYTNKDGAKAKAEELLNQFKSGTVSEDAFAALAKEFTEDTGSVENGGLYENVGKGEMVESFNDWIFDESRKVGDTGLVETDYGWHVMYFVGNGEVKWMLDADTAMKNDAYTKELDGYKGTYKIETNYENLNKIEG